MEEEKGKKEKKKEDNTTKPHWPPLPDSTLATTT